MIHPSCVRTAQQRNPSPSVAVQKSASFPWQVRNADF
jgi:hypothetical protein